MNIKLFFLFLAAQPTGRGGPLVGPNAQLFPKTILKAPLSLMWNPAPTLSCFPLYILNYKFTIYNGILIFLVDNCIPNMGH